ncbi:hypothetical protein LDE01_15660 [Lactobacillus delbrueckii subsp. delbrueckii]|nr:hypothetical protein LDE01_15660 [Lactobacillus delbrueckii subsp. delbrueckii]
MTPNLTAFTGVDSQNLPDVMVSVQFILAIGLIKLIITTFVDKSTNGIKYVERNS